MGWKDRFTFRDKRYIEHEVGGEALHFYPNRMALLTEARDLSAPVAKSISVLFADESKDTSSAVKRHHEGDFFMEDIQTTAISQDMAQFRQSQRDSAIENLMSVLADKRSLMILGKLFMDSLREEFPYKINRGPKEIEEFMYGTEGSDEEYQGLDMPTTIQLFSGWMKANAKVFGEAGEKMVGLVRARLEETLRPSSDSEPKAETDPTNGNSSKTPSAPQSQPDSQPTILTS